MAWTDFHDRTPEGKRFRLVKYFALASFLVFIIFSFPFSVFISNKTKNILTKSYEDYSLLLGRNLAHQVFQNFSVPVISRFGEIRLSDNNQRELMDRVVKNTLHSFNMEVVSLYSIVQDIIAYSTDSDLIGTKAVKTPGYLKAVEGEQTSELISLEGSFLGFGIEKLGGEKKLRTYIPFIITERSTGQQFVASVFELVLDMTEEYKSIVKFQYLIFGLSILIMALIFSSLLLIVHKAERIIEDRAKEQSELERQLHLAERLSALGEMVAGVSHEIKNPLGIIQSTAELLNSMPNADDTQKRLSGVIREESIRLNRIVTEFLDFARPQEPVFRECFLDDIIRKNIAFLSPELEKKAISVKDNLDGRSFMIQADQDLLYRAFMNIFINAVQAIEREGTLTVKVHEDKDIYRIEVEDNGGGISKENLEKIFHPFFTTKENGSGLGLSIVRKIIEGHKGNLDIVSAKGFGTRVTIYLPRARENNMDSNM